MVRVCKGLFYGIIWTIQHSRNKFLFEAIILYYDETIISLQFVPRYHMYVTLVIYIYIYIYIEREREGGGLAATFYKPSNLHKTLLHYLFNLISELVYLNQFISSSFAIESSSLVASPPMLSSTAAATILHLLRQ